MNWAADRIAPGVPTTTDSRAPEGGGWAVLIYASFWGRAWQSEGDRRAELIAKGLAAQAQAAGDATYMQSSFFVDEGWYDGSRGPALNPDYMQRAIQTLITRGAIPESTGHAGDPTAFLLILTDETLSLRAPQPGRAGAHHAHFTAMLGAASYYGVAPMNVEAGESEDEVLATCMLTAGALLRAMRADPAPSDGWAGLPSLGGRADSGDAAAKAERQDTPGGPLPLPSVYASERVPRFRLSAPEVEAWVDRLAWPHTSAAALALRQAALQIEAQVARRATRPTPATAAELRDFSAPNARVTFSERLVALTAHLGDRHPDIAAVASMLAGVSDETFARLRAAYYGNGAYGFIDAVYWVYFKLQLARALGLDASPPLSILDIGCGGGHFSYVCEQLGHTVLGTDIEHALYGEIAAGLGVDRTIHVLNPDTAMPDFGRKFDIVVAAQVEFDRPFPRTTPPTYWSLDNWKFFLNDLMSHQLRYPARIYIALNYETRDGKGVFNEPLMRLCAAHGADVIEKRGVIDWKLDAPTLLSAGD